MNLRRRIKGSAEFDMTPMIDIVFLLIIFFMVSTTLVKNRGMKVNLPSSKMSDSQSKTVLVVSITKNGFFVGDSKQPLNNAGLERAVRLERKNNPSHQTVVIKSDKSVPVQKLIHAMDVSKKAGMKKISIATSRK